jgi:hypothetical protein
MNDENAPAFVLELEIDDEISFKPLKNKRYAMKGGVEEWFVNVLKFVQAF